MCYSINSNVWWSYVKNKLQFFASRQTRVCLYVCCFTSSPTQTTSQSAYLKTWSYSRRYSLLLALPNNNNNNCYNFKNTWSSIWSQFIICEIIGEHYTHLILSEYECSVSLAHSQNNAVDWTASTKHWPRHFSHSKRATPASSYTLYLKSFHV